MSASFNIAIDNNAIVYDNPIFTREINWAHKLLHIPEAWTKATGKGVLVGVIDTGCDCNHDDLDGRVFDGVDCTGEGNYCLDTNGHGTSISSIIAAKKSGHGVAGVAPDSKLFVAKSVDSGGTGESKDIKCAIEASINAGCSVINVSLGSREPYPEIENIIEEAVKNNVIFIAAAGNSGDILIEDNSGYPLEDWPARLPYVISVAAINRQEKVPEWSSPGDIEFSAPGVDIVSCYPGNKYVKNSGTSQAAPFVTGICALLKEKDPNINFQHIVEILSKYSLTLGDDRLYGAGIINVGSVVNAFSLFKKG